ncbi:hypothetical protein B0H34DRAFT_794771 [Crassisporium funariophilum]|nr:hypothetical protein B0H34DRAFT_794771 [Crassisporium funariophilum]
MFPRRLWEVESEDLQRQSGRDMFSLSRLVLRRVRCRQMLENIHLIRLSHRHSDSHSCSPQFLTDVSRKNEAAEKKVADRPSSSALPFKSFQSRRAKIPTDPAKLAQYQKMQLMKMRHQAFPGDPRDKNIPIPPEQRLHVRMVIEGAEKVFWFRKTLVTGKALDLLSAYLKLVSTDTQLFRMCKVSPANEECIYLRNDRLLVDEIEDGAMVVICPKI